jgi:hypothetical protein
VSLGVDKVVTRLLVSFEQLVISGYIVSLREGRVVGKDGIPWPTLTYVWLGLVSSGFISTDI